MSAAILELIGEAVSSPWFYLALFAVVALDSLLPLLPSEAVVITAGVFAAAGESDLVAVVAVAAAGALAGDHLCYAVGRTGGVRVTARLPAGSRRRAAHDRAGRQLAARGGLVLLVSRFIPGGRTAVTLTCGSVRYPILRFGAFDAVAALTWALYAALLGYLGGRVFEGNPLAGLLVGLGVALAVTAAVESVRAVRRRARCRAMVR